MFFLNTTLSNNQKIDFALTKIFGLGKSSSKIICRKLGFTNNFKVLNLSKIQKLKIIRQIELSEIFINSDLVRSIKTNKARLVSSRCYRGVMAKQGFPVRGQRTHTNANTAKKFKNL